MRTRPPVRKASDGGRVYIHQPVSTTGPGPGSPRCLNYVQDNHHEFVRGFYTKKRGVRFGLMPMNNALPDETLLNILAEIHKEPSGIRMRAHNKWFAHLEGLDNSVRCRMNAGPGEDRFTVKRNLYRLSPKKVEQGNLVDQRPDYGITLDKEAHDYFSTLRVPVFGSSGIRATFSLNPVQWVRHFSTSARMRQMVREATFMAYLKTGNLAFAKQVYGDMLDSTKYKNQSGMTGRDFLMKHAGRADTTFQKVYQSIKYRPAHQLQAAAVGFTSGHGGGNRPGPELQSEETQAQRRRQQNDGDFTYDIKDDGKYDIKDDVIGFDEADSKSENYLSLKPTGSSKPTAPQSSDSTTPKHNSGWHSDLEDGRKDRNSLSGRGSVPYGKLENDDLNSSNLEQADKVK